MVTSSAPTASKGIGAHGAGAVGEPGRQVDAHRLLLHLEVLAGGQVDPDVVVVVVPDLLGFAAHARGAQDDAGDVLHHRGGRAAVLDEGLGGAHLTLGVEGLEAQAAQPPDGRLVLLGARGLEGQLPAVAGALDAPLQAGLVEVAGGQVDFDGGIVVVGELAHRQRVAGGRTELADELLHLALHEVGDLGVGDGGAPAQVKAEGGGGQALHVHARVAGVAQARHQARDALGVVGAHAHAPAVGEAARGGPQGAGGPGAQGQGDVAGGHGVAFAQHQRVALGVDALAVQKRPHGGHQHALLTLVAAEGTGLHGKLGGGVGVEAAHAHLAVAGALEVGLQGQHRGQIVAQDFDGKHLLEVLAVVARVAEVHPQVVVVVAPDLLFGDAHAVAGQHPAHHLARKGRGAAVLEHVGVLGPQVHALVVEAHRLDLFADGLGELLRIAVDFHFPRGEILALAQAQLDARHVGAHGHAGQQGLDGLEHARDVVDVHAFGVANLGGAHRLFDHLGGKALGLQHLGHALGERLDFGDDSDLEGGGLALPTGSLRCHAGRSHALARRPGGARGCVNQAAARGRTGLNGAVCWRSRVPMATALKGSPDARRRRPVGVGEQNEES
jgi:hypothetical protein